MKTIFRWVFIFLGSLFLILVIATVVAWHYKPEITNAIHDKIKENINGEFNIDDISVSVVKDFPQVSVTLEGIYLRGLKYNVYKKDFLSAKRVVVNINLYRLFRKEIDVKSIKIEEASVFIFTTKSGYSNLDIFKAKKVAAKDTAQGQNPDLLNIHRIYFDHVAIAVQDSAKGKAFGFTFINGKNEVVGTDSSRQFSYEGNIYFDRLQFNATKGSYLLNQNVNAKLNGEFVAGSKSLKIDPSELAFAKYKLDLSGGFHFVPDGGFTLNIKSSDLIYEEGRSLLPKALGDKLKNYAIGSPFILSTEIIGKLAPGSDPSVDLHFETNQAPITIGKEHIAKASVKGSFTNHADAKKDFSDRNSRITISSFEGVLFGLPVKMEATFDDLIDPVVNLAATVHADAKSFQREMDSTLLVFKNGELNSQISLKGKLNAFLDPQRYGNSGKVQATVDVKNMTVKWVQRNISVDNVTGTIALNKGEFLIRNFSFLINKSKVSVAGSVTNYTPWLPNSTQKGFVKLNVTSSDLNLTGMIPETNVKPTAKDEEKKMKAISQLVDNIYKKLEFELALKVDKFQQRDFKASAIYGKVSLRNNELQSNRITMIIAGGDVDFTFGLSQLNKPVNPLYVEANVHHADIKNFFFGFHNFNQHSIESQNLSGTISADIGFNGMLDDDFNMMMPTLIGKVDATVKDGKLTHFAPLEKMSNFLFKKRDFSDVEFAEIKSNFDLKGTELTIKRMEVESSVISLFIEGRYSLADSTDLTIQLPLSNLKRRDKDYKPRNVGVDSKVGPSVFLRARADDQGNIGISYDPFHKFRKK